MVEAEDSDDDGIVGPEGKPCGLLGEHTSARMTVLLVEDDVVTCKLVADGLKACRYDVVLARNGRVALDIMASEKGSKIDIILTDIKMPEVSGIELASEVMGKKGHPPIVVMSTDFHPDTVISALAAGASEFLCKPLKKESLLSLQRHTQLMPGKALSRQSEKLNFANLETKAAAQPPQQAMQASKGSAFQSTQSGKRGADFIDIASTKRQRLPFQLRADGTSHSFPAAFQPGADRRQNERQSAPIAIRDQSNMQLAAALEAQQAAAPMRNASWPPSTKSVAIESMGPSNSHQNPMLSRQALFAGLNPKGPGLNLDIKPLQRVGKLVSSVNYEAPQRSQERLPALNAKAKSSGLQALRYSEHMSAFSPVFPRHQATMTSEDRRPHIFQTEGVPRSQHVGLQQHHALASLPMIASLNLPPLIAPQPVFYQALRAFQEASVTPPKPVNTATANRKAAIERFRAKRTQRSFEKKVRYTSRQRLAENRPRLKGQFVKAPSQSGELPEATPSTELTSGNSSEAQP